MTDKRTLTADDFEYDYFDNPQTEGYRGYYKHANGDYPVLAWADCARFCRDAGVASAIDLGCAKGYLVDALLREGIAAVGYDISRYALSFAVNLPCRYHDIRKSISDTADAVFALGLLQYFEEQDELPNVLHNIHSAARQFLLFSSYYAGEPQEVPDPLRRITRPRVWWRNTLSQSGFTFEKSEECFDVYHTTARAGLL